MDLRARRSSSAENLSVKQLKSTFLAGNPTPGKTYIKEVTCDKFAHSNLITFLRRKYKGDTDFKMEEKCERNFYGDWFHYVVDKKNTEEICVSLWFQKSKNKLVISWRR